MKRLLVVVGVILYLITLVFAYRTASDDYAYYGLVYNPPDDYFWVLLSFLISILPALWMPLEIQRPSQVAYWILYLFTVIPMSFIPLYTRSMPVTDLLLFQLAIVISFVTIGTIYRLPLSRAWHFRVPSDVFWPCFVLVTLGMYLAVIYTYGISFELHKFATVGDVRADFKGEAAETSRIASYVLVGLGASINPVIIALGLVRRRPVLVGGGIAGQLLLYSLTAARSILLSPLILVGALAGLSQKKTTFGIFVLISFSLLILVCPILDGVVGTEYFSSVLRVRLLFVPSMLGGMYYEYYSGNSHVMMSDSLLGPLLFDRAEQSASAAIAHFYMGSDLTCANAHIWASAFADFGFLGIIVVTVVLGMLLYIYDSASQSMDLKLSALLVAIHAVSWTNVALHTSLLTHGVALTWLLVILFPQEAAICPIPGETAVGKIAEEVVLPFGNEGLRGL